MTICGSLRPICGSVITAGFVRVRIRVRVWVTVRVRVGVRVRIKVRVRVRFRVANCCIETAGESDKMRINHVIKTDQCRAAPQIRPAPHFVVRGVATGVYRYMYPQNQSTFKKLRGRSSVTQDRFDMIYVHVWDINICFEIAMTS